ncbi:MAG: MmgE/PrpD family protein [Dehalococcoidales bacterium]|nr:MmgE/PrpD family protein [Dehalococcoidales bacterium]
MSVVTSFSEYVVGTSFKTLPREAIEPTKKQILDTLGCAAAGASHQVVEPVADLFKEWGGKPEATIISYGGRVPCMQAALVNGFLAGVTDFDDYNDTDFPHTSRQNVPAAFAMAERLGNVSGKEFMTAVAIGYDITCRLSRGVHLHFDAGWYWDPSTLFSFFGCAAASGKLLHLNQQQVVNSFGLALQQANGLLEGIHAGMNSKGLHAGRAAAGGIFAALLAERGLAGTTDPLQGNRGLFDIFFHNVYSEPMITVDLGKVFAAKTSAFKPYPCCGFNGTTIDATLALVKEHNIKAQDVVEVNVQGGRNMCRQSEPRENKIHPASPVASEFSIPWAAAVAIVHGKVGIDNFTEEAIHNDKKVIALAPKVNFKLNPEFNTCEDYEPALVAIKLQNGKVYSKLAAVRYGHWKNPMKWEAIVEKFKYCCSFAAKPISTRKVNTVIKMVEDLEKVPDVSQIIRQLG